jgi:hypothetical protein
MRRMRWAAHVARMEDKRSVYSNFWGNLKERTHLEDLWVEGRIILK